MSKGTLIAFLQGILIGAGIAILTAPRSGKQTRSWLSSEADAAKDILEGNINKKMSDLKAFQSDVQTKATKGLNDAKAKATETYSKNRSKFENLVNQN
jgi:gas vesicle protein